SVQPPPPDNAQLELRVTVVSGAVPRVGETTVVDYTVFNGGPATATGITLTIDVPPEVSLVATPDACGLNLTQLVCAVPQLLIGQSYTVRVETLVNVVSSSIVYEASVMGDQTDPVTLDNDLRLAVQSFDAIPTSTPTMTVTPTTMAVATSTPTPVPATGGSGEDSAASGSSGTGGGMSPSTTANGSSSGTQGGTAPTTAEFGWTRHESSSLIPKEGDWVLRQSPNASALGYHETENARALFQFPFEGDGVRVGFRSEVNGGLMQVFVDGISLGAFQTDQSNFDIGNGNPRQTFRTPPFFLETAGYHLLEIVAINDVGGSQSVNIDYVETFVGPPSPLPSATPFSPDQMAAVVREVEVVGIPPTLMPTATVVPSSVFVLDVYVASDEDTDGVRTPTEGISDVTIRAVGVTTTQLLGTAVTDLNGYARLVVVSSEDVR
ncbi:MAG: hypothetical protein AAF125_24260, partial [Chloroflexota bacterium]